MDSTGARMKWLITVGGYGSFDFEGTEEEAETMRRDKAAWERAPARKELIGQAAMNVLVGCEESQVVTKAFRDAGHEAYSCDLQPTRGNPDWHYQGDIKAVILGGFWDLIILHPVCTKMAVCNNKLCAKGKPQHQDRLDAIEWTMDLWELAKAHADGVVLENPASVIFPHLRKAGAIVQYIQPWMFGHPEQKKTGLALHNVSPLIETNNVYEEMMKLPKNERERMFYMPPGENRTRDRSETYLGIGEAMASQWAL